jgi:Raf kinase inhibitor-like YbhB/YbcL family protein
MHAPRLISTVSLLLLFTCVSACRHAGTSVAAGVSAAIALSSTSFQNGKIPSQYTCDGADSSPQLSWPAPPAATKSFALLMIDPDAPGEDFVHWVLFNIPATTRELPAGLPRQDQLPDNSRQGQNDFSKNGYGGPCPPSGTHH